VYTWTVVHGPTLPVFQDQLLDCPPHEIRAALPVGAVFVPVSDDITLVKFRRLRPV
jgi:hypothetical protein